MTEKITKSQAVANDVAALLRARNPLLWITTREELRVEQYIFEAAASAQYKCRFWDVAQGFTELNGNQYLQRADYQIPDAAMQLINQRATSTGEKERCVWVMRDLPVWMTGQGGAVALRMLRNLARLLPATERDTAQAVVVLAAESAVPPELSGIATAIDWPLPDREEIASYLDSAVESLPEDMQKQAAPNGKREQAIDAAMGLSGDEAQANFAKCLVQLRRIDPVMVANEKKRIITRERVLEWMEPLPGGLDAVGGLDLAKTWLMGRTAAYTPDARNYGLRFPKGLFLVGVPGCGKSMLPKALATHWQRPLLRADFGALKGSLVGQSESNMRRMFKVIEAIGPCILLVDEIEKALAGAAGGLDSGVSADQLGSFLTWMQERSSQAFVVATANNVEALPPELLRKGRFDEVFFVDLPNRVEREQVLAATLNQNGRGKLLAKLDSSAIVSATDGFSGAEIAALVPDAMFMAFADGKRELTTADLLACARSTEPLSKTAEDKIKKLREWSVGKARRATSEEVAAPKQTKRGRVVDFA